MKVLNILFFPPVAAIVGAAIGVTIAAQDPAGYPCDYGNELCGLTTVVLGIFGVAVGFGVGLVVYVAWGIITLLRKRRAEKRQLEGDD